MVVGSRDLSSHHGKSKSSFTRDKEPFQSTLAAVRGLTNKTEDAPGRSVLCQLPPCLRASYWRLTSGRTLVPSARTAYSSAGLMSSALRMVGATWAVPTSARTVFGWKDE
jgi:hypothetical protein